MQHVLVVLQ